MKTVKILVVETNKNVYVVETKTIYKTLYGLVYYPYNKMKMEGDIYLIYSKNTDDILKKNRIINNLQIYGTFVIVKEKDNQILSLNDKEIERLKQYFQKEGDKSI